MSDNIYGLKDVKNEVMVKEIRQKFLLEAENNKHLYHSIDVERCRSEDWQIERFLIEKGTPDEALKALVTAMQWKKSFGVHERTRIYFPKELFKILSLSESLVFTKNNQGQVYHWITLRNYLPNGDFTELIKEFFTFFLETIDRFVGNKGYIGIADAKGLTLKNVDLPLALAGVHTFEHYPQSLVKNLLVDLPWPIEAFWKIVCKFLSKANREKSLAIRREDIPKHIDLDFSEVPDINEKRIKTESEVNTDLLAFHDCKHLNFSEKQIQLFYKIYSFDK